jgi:hypothetical protein
LTPKACKKRLVQRTSQKRTRISSSHRVENLNPRDLADNAGNLPSLIARTRISPWLKEPKLSFVKFMKLTRYQHLKEVGRTRVFTLSKSERKTLESPFIQCMIGDTQGDIKVFGIGCNAFLSKDPKLLRQCLRILLSSYYDLRAFGPKNLGLRYYLVRRKILSSNIGKLRLYRNILSASVPKIGPS